MEALFFGEMVGLVSSLPEMGGVLGKMIVVAVSSPEMTSFEIEAIVHGETVGLALSSSKMAFFEVAFIGKMGGVALFSPEMASFEVEAVDLQRH